MSQLVGELVKCGQQNNRIMSTALLMWESITTAGIQVVRKKVESGASPLIQIRNGSTALFHIAIEHTNAKISIHGV